MKFFKWKSFLITAGVCLLPILLGIALWDKLPDMIAIHFDINNNPDNYATKTFTVFIMPLFMVVAQAFCCLVNDINAYKHGARKKFECVTKWIIPVMTIVLQAATFAYALGWNFDIRKVVAFIVGVIFVLIGNYLPKFDYIKNYDVDTQKARKINRFIGFESVFMGILFWISIFLPPVATVVCLFLMIPYVIIGVVYGIKEGRK